MVRDEDEGQDWRSVSTRALNPEELAEARQRAHEPGRGRRCDRPRPTSPRPAGGTSCWRVFWAMPQDRVLTTAGGVAFFALLAVFPGLVAVVSIYGLFSDPNVISQHVSLLADILPAGALDLLSDQLVRIAQRSTGSLSTTSRHQPADRAVERQFRCQRALRRPQRDLQGAREAHPGALLRHHLPVHPQQRGVLPRLHQRGRRCCRRSSTGSASIAATDTILQIARWPALLGRRHPQPVADLPLRPEPEPGEMALGDLGQQPGGPALGRRLGGLLLVRGELRQLQPHLRLAGRRHRLHDLDVAVDRHRARWAPRSIRRWSARPAATAPRARPKPLGVRRAFAADSVGPSQD